MIKTVLECNHLIKRIGQKVIVNDVSFSLREGDILGFIGPNGVGKTTTIKLLLGLQYANSGSVSIVDFDIRKNFVQAIKNVGAIIENPDLYMYLSGFDNLSISAKYYGISADRVREVVKLVGLEDSIYKQVKKYSLGMRQRLGIAQAILHNPKVLILDEPMNGLDPIGIRELKDLLVRLANNGIGIIISSHILSELENICNRFCIMLNGKIVEDITKDEMVKRFEQQQYLLEVSNTSINNILFNYEEVDNNHIRIFTTKDKLDIIIKTLLLNNISIYEIRKERLSLERIFLNIADNNHV